MALSRTIVFLLATLSIVGCSQDKPEQEEEVIPKGDAGRRMYFEKRCDSGHAGMCGELALMWKKGWGGDKDPAKAKELYKKACDEGVPEACAEVGIDLTPERQVEILEANCQKGVAFACNNAGHLFWMSKDVANDPVKARKYLNLGCDGGFSASCRAMVKILATGVGGPKDEDAARKMKEKADAAQRAEMDLELKYLHAKPMNQRHVGKARPALIEARKRRSKETRKMNEELIDDRLKQKAKSENGSP